MLEDLRDQRAQFRRTRQVGAVARNVDASEHGLAIAVGDEALDIRDHGAHRHRARIAAAVGNNAESAAVIAAVLHLHERARTPGKAVDQMRGGFLHRHDVVDDRFLGAGDVEFGAGSRPSGCAQLLHVAEYPIRLGHGRECPRLGLCRAAGDDDLRQRTLSA